MSEETMAALMTALADDETLRARLRDSSSAKDVVRVAGEAGFDISVEDLHSTSGATVELSDADLDVIAGGETAPPTFYCTLWMACGIPGMS